MRPIKFRVWDDCSKEFFYQHAAMFLRIEDGTPVWYKFLEKPRNNVNVHCEWPAHLVLQQYTGINDKNGFEIYEGDKIEYQGGVGTVEFFAGMFVCSWYDQTDTELGYMLTADMKIVGNIFEK